MTAEDAPASATVPPAHANVFVATQPLPEGLVRVEGYDFNQGNSISDMLRNAYPKMGFQATSLGEAIQIVDRMLEWRLSDEPIADDETEPFRDPTVRQQTRCKIFLGYTSNMSSCGMREILRYLVQHRLVDVLVTTAGGVEEDFVKCLAPTYVNPGGFRSAGKDMRARGLNRIGNLVVPNENYCRFEDWLMPVLDQMLVEQKEEGYSWTPSKMIHRLGKEINHPESIYYWCYRNNIPVYCPAITDGSLGDMIYFHSYKNPGLRVDIAEDIRSINNEAVYAKKTGMIVLGGGLVKHHICNANLMRNGADFAVYINTGHEFDGSDSGADPDEAVSWGKIRANAKAIKICADATLVFPLLVSETFVKYHHRRSSVEVGVECGLAEMVVEVEENGQQ